MRQCIMRNCPRPTFTVGSLLRADKWIVDTCAVTIKSCERFYPDWWRAARTPRETTSSGISDERPVRIQQPASTSDDRPWGSYRICCALDNIWSQFCTANLLLLAMNLSKSQHGLAIKCAEYLGSTRCIETNKPRWTRKPDTPGQENDGWKVRRRWRMEKPFTFCQQKKTAGHGRFWRRTLYLIDSIQYSGMLTNHVALKWTWRT